MRKLLREESTGFKTGTGKINFLVVFLALSLEIFPQIPVNGFCRYQQFDVAAGFTNLFPVNYNNDSYTDLILFNPSEKKILAVNGFQNSTFDQFYLHNCPYQISEIQTLRDTNQNITGYAFISRKQSSAGILKITNAGLPEAESVIKFNSYPQDLNCADINGDGIPELLISGGTFNGLSIVYNENKLREVKVSSGTSYPEAVFTDLNNDGYPDIAAFELFTKSLHFFYNNSAGVFKKVRNIPINNSVYQLSSADIDIDSYDDLIISSDKKLSIYYGDFSSSYEDSINIYTQFKVDKFITGDFNKDGKIDIAYLNNEEGILSVIFAKESRRFYPELLYLQKDSLTDITPYYSKFVDGISLLSGKGKVFLVSNLASFSDSVSIVSGAHPLTVSYFDKDNNGINDLCFIDSYNQTLNLLIRNSSGIPDIWFSLPLFESESAIAVNDKNSQYKAFYCYTLDKQLVEVLNIDLKSNKFSRNSFYTSGIIKDLKIKQGTGDVYAAYLKDHTLGVTVFSSEYEKHSFYSVKDIRRDVSDAVLSVNSNPEIYYAAAENDTIMIGEKFIQGNKIKFEKNMKLRSNYDIILFAGNYNKSGNALFILLTSGGKNNQMIYINPDGSVISDKNNIPPGLRIIDKNQLFFGELRLNDPKLCLYDNNQQTIYSFDIKNRKINRDIIADQIFTRSFFIKNMSTQAYHLVYINNIDNCITIKELK